MIKVKWTFSFDQYPVSITTHIAEENDRIAQALASNDKSIVVVGEDGVGLHINLEQVNFVTRQILQEHTLYNPETEPTSEKREEKDLSA